MDVIGARFGELSSALAARDAILATVAMMPADVGVRPLGTTRYDEPIDAYLLAGRFEPGAVATVARLVREHGGTIIAGRVEQRRFGRSASEALTRSPAAARAPIPPIRKRLRRPAALLRVRAARAARLS